MKKCPYCAEEVQEEAIKCKHCGEIIKKRVLFNFEIVNQKGRFLPWSLAAYRQEEVERYILDKGWKLISIWRKGQPKQIIDQEYMKLYKEKEAKTNRTASIICILFFALVILGLFIQYGLNKNNDLSSLKNSSSSSLPEYDKKRVSEIASKYGMSTASVKGMMSAIEKGRQQGAKKISQALNEGKVSHRNLEMYDYMQQRWHFYESRDGYYNPELHDPLVLEDASRKYGVSEQKADAIYMNVAKMKSGAF